MQYIFEAALHNQTEVIKEYLKFGNVNATDDSKMSLLHYAVMGNAIEVANLLLDNYANLNIKNNKGETPLFLAVIKGEVGFAKLLCRFGADVNATNNLNESVYFKAIIKGNKAIVDLLEDTTQIDYELVNDNGENILHYYLKIHNDKLFINLAEKFPKLINQKDCNNANLLMLAIKHDNYQITKYLLDKGFNIYECDFLNNNSLFYAAKYASCDILRLLLDKKPIIAGKNKNGLDIFDLSKENTHPTEVLLDNYKNSYDYLQYVRTYPFHVAVVARNYDLLEYANIDIKKRDIYGLLIIDYIEMVNDKIINKIFNIKPKFLKY